MHANETIIPKPHCKCLENIFQYKNTVILQNAQQTHVYTNIFRQLS